MHTPQQVATPPHVCTPVHRSFLNAVATDIIHYNSQKLTYYKGDYNQFELTRYGFGNLQWLKRTEQKEQKKRRRRKKKIRGKCLEPHSSPFLKKKEVSFWLRCVVLLHF